MYTLHVDVLEVVLDHSFSYLLLVAKRHRRYEWASGHRHWHSAKFTAIYEHRNIRYFCLNELRNKNTFIQCPQNLKSFPGSWVCTTRPRILAESWKSRLLRFGVYSDFTQTLNKFAVLFADTSHITLQESPSLRIRFQQSNRNTLLLTWLRLILQQSWCTITSQTVQFVDSVRSRSCVKTINWSGQNILSIKTALYIIVDVLLFSTALSRCRWPVLNVGEHASMRALHLNIAVQGNRGLM